jgi:hypothetical protein
LLNGEGDYIFNDIIVKGVAIGRASNPDLKWESTTQFNVATDLTLGRYFTTTVNYFVKQTKDLLFQPDVSGVLGTAGPGSYPPIINAGDGRHAHPSQALLDLFTIRERLGRLAGLNIVIVGDIIHSRVARSDIWGMLRCGANVTLCGPSTLIGDTTMWQATFPNLRISYTLNDLLPDTDVLMALRIQKERQQAGLLPSLREYSNDYGLTQERMDRLPAHAIVMHPGPMNEGVEIMPEAATSPRSTSGAASSPPSSSSGARAACGSCSSRTRRSRRATTSSSQPSRASAKRLSSQSSRRRRRTRRR